MPGERPSPIFEYCVWICCRRAFLLQAVFHTEQALSRFIDQASHKLSMTGTLLRLRYIPIAGKPDCRNCSLIDFTSLSLISLQLDNASASDFCAASDAAIACVVGVESAPSTRFIIESSSLASLARPEPPPPRGPKPPAAPSMPAAF